MHEFIGKASVDAIRKIIVLPHTQSYGFETDCFANKVNHSSESRSDFVIANSDARDTQAQLQLSCINAVEDSRPA